jgi:glycine/D-amino acid oxidase-like deaminating enzyme
MQVAICGGGVIGACAAYFLSLRGIEVIVIERAEVAAAASFGPRLVRRHPEDLSELPYGSPFRIAIA